jgi:ankyrin repeat protein
MDVIETNTQEKIPRHQFPRILFWIGVPIVLLNVAFALRVAWEQTFLTWRSGPQMIPGHNELFLALIGFYGFFMGLPWALMTLAQMISTRSLGGVRMIILAGIYALATTAEFLPYEAWQYAFAERLAKGKEPGYFLVHAAADGNTRLVKRFLDCGIPVNATTDDGRTPLHVAASAGETRTVALLLARGADVNALNKFGDSPLGEARFKARAEAAALLEARGGKDIRGP